MVRRLARPQFIPGLTSLEDRILRQIVIWWDEYTKLKESAEFKKHYLEPPTTKRCTTYFEIAHSEMLALISRLEKQGYVVKRRRRSAGITGYGYDGSLYSEVAVTPKARELVAKFF